MKNLFLKLFFFACIGACTGMILFCGYVLYRQATNEPNYFDASIIHHIKPWIVYASIGACAAGIITAFIGARLLGKNNKLYILLFALLFIGSGIALYAGDYFIRGIEGIYVKKSPYYKLFLGAAIPLLLCMLMGLAGLVIKLVKKPEPKNPFQEQ